jgi:MOSC domain-containing protein YiiM
MTALVEDIYISKERRKPLQTVETVQLEAGKGIVGDRYHEQAVKQLATGDTVKPNHLSLIAKEELDAFLANNNAQIPYRDFRRNILTRGIDLNSLVGTKFRVGDALCQGIEYCEPCAFLAATVHRAVLPELQEKAGLRAIILEDGNLEVGSSIVPVED